MLVWVYLPYHLYRINIMLDIILGKLKVYTFELIITLCAVIVGLHFFDATVPFIWRSYEVALGVCFLLAGITGLVGIFWLGKNIDTEWLLIRIGLIVLTFSWLGFAIALNSTGIFLAVASLILFMRLVVRELDLRREIDRG